MVLLNDWKIANIDISFSFERHIGVDMYLYILINIKIYQIIVTPYTTNIFKSFGQINQRAVNDGKAQIGILMVISKEDQQK